MMEYRRRIKSDVWHFHELCRWWPGIDIEHHYRYEKPTSGELCNECLAKAKRGT